MSVGRVRSLAGRAVRRTERRERCAGWRERGSRARVGSGMLARRRERMRDFILGGLEMMGGGWRWVEWEYCCGNG